MKTIRKGFALLFKTTLLTLLVAVLTPILYFACRAAQPIHVGHV
jgi:nitrogen fixation/metabolism regulation signal transduction histidine kinase